MFEVTFQVGESGYESLPNVVSVERIEPNIYEVHYTGGDSEIIEDAIIRSVNE